MNQLSWLIYLANVSGNSIVILVISLLLSIGVFTTIVCYGGHIKDSYHNSSEEWHTAHTMQVSAIKRGATTFAVLSLLIVLTPRAETVYAIAASEMGEKVIKSETGGKALNALDIWLDKQISEEKK